MPNVGQTMRSSPFCQCGESVAQLVQGVPFQSVALRMARPPAREVLGCMKPASNCSPRACRVSARCLSSGSTACADFHSAIADSIESSSRMVPAPSIRM